MIIFENRGVCCGLADPLTPLAAAALPDGVPTAGHTREICGWELDVGDDAHSVFDGYRPDFWTVGRPGLRDIEVCIEGTRRDGAISLGLVVNGLDCSGVPVDEAISIADARGDAGACGVSCRGGGHLKAS